MYTVGGVTSPPECSKNANPRTGHGGGRSQFRSKGEKPADLSRRPADLSSKFQSSDCYKVRLCLKKQKGRQECGGQKAFTELVLVFHLGSREWNRAPRSSQVLFLMPGSRPFYIVKMCCLLKWQDQECSIPSYPVLFQSICVCMLGIYVSVVSI